jgi:predicted DNA-binding protein YlxM (UPF0122 family)
MDNIARISRVKDSEYQQIFGILKPTFEAMLAILEEEFEQLHKQGGRPPKLSVLDRLVITLGYYREYRTMAHIAFDYDISKSCISEAVKWVEETLLKSGAFALPSKRELLKADTEIEVVIIDVTEQETERPKKNRVNHTQVNINATPSKNS